MKSEAACLAAGCVYYAVGSLASSFVVRKYLMRFSGIAEGGGAQRDCVTAHASIRIQEHE